MYDVITIGSATRDVFVRSGALDTHKSDHAPTGVECCFPLGAKIELDELIFETGGGATNAAVTFSRLGWRTAVVTAIGQDASGRDVLEALKADHIYPAFVQRRPKEQTAFSLITLVGGGERTVLVYRGASEAIEAKKIPWSRLLAKWLYVTSLGGNLELMSLVLAHAGRHGIKVAWNPGTKELKNGLDRLAPLIRQTDVFNLNVEEAMQLTGQTTRDVASLMGKLAGLPRRAAVITDGLAGAYASDGRGSWHSQIIEAPRVNVTGAGDAFGSGLVAGLMRQDDLPFAMAVGIWNATGIVQKMGAKRGIIRRYPSPAAIKKVVISPWPGRL